MAETKKQKKIEKVMSEFKDEKLKGRDNKTITNPKQAIAIALSQAEKMAKGGAKRDPKVGTGRKPKGSDRRLYTDENPKDTVRIKYATVQDAKETIKKVKNIAKSFARKIQILTVLEQRAKFAGKPEQARLARKAKESLRKKRTVTASKGAAVLKPMPPKPEGKGIQKLAKESRQTVIDMGFDPERVASAKKGGAFGKGGFAEGGIIKGFTKGRQF